MYDKLKPTGTHNLSYSEDREECKVEMQFTYRAVTSDRIVFSASAPGVVVSDSDPGTEKPDMKVEQKDSDAKITIKFTVKKPTPGFTMITLILGRATWPIFV